MSLIELNRDPTDRQLRQFAGIVLPLCALLLAVLVGWRRGQWAAGWGILVVGGADCARAACFARRSPARSISAGCTPPTRSAGWLAM